MCQMLIECTVQNINFFPNQSCDTVCESGLCGGQLSQMLHESIPQLLTKATPSLLRAAGRQGLLDGGRGGGGQKEDKREKWSDVKRQTPGETPTGGVIKLRQTLFQSQSRGNQTQTPTTLPNTHSD